MILLFLRWILPLLCRRGHITKNEIGAIRIAAGETRFEVPRAVAARFAKTVERTAEPGSDGERGILIEASAAPAPQPRGRAEGRGRPPVRKGPGGAPGARGRKG